MAWLALLFGRGALPRDTATGWGLGTGTGLFALIPLQFMHPDCAATLDLALVWHGLVPPLAAVASVVGLQLVRLWFPSNAEFEVTGWQQRPDMVGPVIELKPPADDP